MAVLAVQANEQRVTFLVADLQQKVLHHGA
jgi:hypothetical protein